MLETGKVGLANKGQIKLQEGFYTPRMMDLDLQTDGETDCQRLSSCRKKKSVMHVPQQFRKPSHCFHPSTVLVLLFPRNVFPFKSPYGMPVSLWEWRPTSLSPTPSNHSVQKARHIFSNILPRGVAPWQNGRGSLLGGCGKMFPCLKWRSSAFGLEIALCEDLTPGIEDAPQETTLQP